jgi:enoyl-CoA hydratase/carnithine racemase
MQNDSEHQFIGYEASDRIATITLNRPEAANAQTPELLEVELLGTLAPVVVG